MPDWFYAPEGRTEGPVPIETLARLLRGTLPPDTPVWRDGFTDWVPANTLPELAAHIPRPPAPAAPTGPPPPVAAATGPAAGFPGSTGADARSLNPFVVLRRSFSWKGRFTRGEYLMAIVASTVLAMGLGFILGLAMGFGGTVGGIVGGLLLLCFLPVSMIVGLGANVRRMNDLGLSAWWLLAAFVPLANLAFFLYLLFAPTSPRGTTLDRTPVAAIVVAVLFAVVMLLGIVAAIAVPSLLRARTAANEAVAIGWLRAVNSAEITYSTSNAGLYESRLECLVGPSQCIPGYTGPPFLDASSGLASRSGYGRRLEPGRSFAPADLPAGASPSSTNGYAAITTPETAGSRTFCTDATGTIVDVSLIPADAIAEVLGEEPWIRCSSAGVPVR